MVKFIVTYSVEKRKVIFAPNREEAKYKFNRTMDERGMDFESISYIEEEK